MKKLLFVFFVLAVVLGSNSLYAQHVSMVSNDDEREIPLFPAGSEEGGPVARSIIIQPASAYIGNDAVSVVFKEEMSSVNISIKDASTGATVYSETYFNPTLVTIDLSAKAPGQYYLEIVSEEVQLSGYFTL